MVFVASVDLHSVLVRTPVCVLQAPVQFSVLSTPTFTVPVIAAAFEHFRSTTTCAASGVVMSNSPW